jgi:transcription elongation factor Elf1
MNIELQRVVQHFNAVDKGGTWFAECPICGRHSLSLDAGKKAAVVAHCFNCEGGNQVQLARKVLDIAMSNLPVVAAISKPREKHSWTEEELWRRLEGAELKLTTDRSSQAFLAGRGIPLATAQALRIGSGDFYYDHRIVIPYLDGEFSETVLQLRYRQVSTTADKSKKWRCEKRSLGGRRLFNLPLLRSWDPESTRPVVITEAELDALMLLALGIDACSVDTAGHVPTKEDLELLCRVRNVVIAFDTDDAGAKCVERFKKVLPKAKVLGGFNAKDLGDLRTTMGPEAFEQRIKRFLERVENK